MTHSWLFALAISVVLIPGAVLAKNNKKIDFTDTFPIAECQFTPIGTNPYFTLQENRELHFNNWQCFADGECDEFEELVITVTPETKLIEFELDGEMIAVNTRVVREDESADGEFVEESHNFYAECAGTQDVYYFGEDVVVADGSHPGQWLAGENGALPGIIFPGGAFVLGARYFQEIAEQDGALDRAEHVEMGLELDLPVGTLNNCVKVDETTPLAKKELSEKWYCRNVGLVGDGDLKLIEVVEP